MGLRRRLDGRDDATPVVLLAHHPVRPGSYPARVDLRFSGELWHWRGPSPFHFVTVPEGESEAISEVSGRVSYGWGVIPVSARIQGTEWTTSLFPKDGGYVVPVKDAVRRAESLEIGDTVTIRLSIDV